MGITYAWAPITKAERQPDGSVMVVGPMSDALVDRDGQGMNQAWLDQAAKRWFDESANIREQHDPKKAAGVGVGLHRKDDGAWVLQSRIVDPTAALKCLPGPNGARPVYQGYSIGVREPRLSFEKPQFPGGEVVGGYICEVSLADRPSNPRSVFTLAKSDGHEVTAIRRELTALQREHAAQMAGLPALVAANVSRRLAAAKSEGAAVARKRERLAFLGKLLDEVPDRELAHLSDAEVIRRVQASQQDLQKADDLYRMSAEDWSRQEQRRLERRAQQRLRGEVRNHEQEAAALEKTAAAMATENLPVLMRGYRELAEERRAEGRVGFGRVRAAELRRQAQEFLAKADLYAGEDPATAQAYRKAAAELRAEADQAAQGR